MNKYRVIGLMSGTSLDGLDIAYCEFRKNREWNYRILKSATLAYNAEWRERLSGAFEASPKEIRRLDQEYGLFLGRQVKRFIRRWNIRPDFIASHGHTVFHRPDLRRTLQIGNGKTISSVSGLPVVCDFRSGDVALGGQGAPLVPMADKLLFSRYDFCLNLGGIANISFDQDGKRVAYDICPVNMVLNDLAGRLGKEFDRGGKLAAKGRINRALLERLNGLSYYPSKPPKSLGREWVENKFLPVLDSFRIPVRDKLRTVCEHAAIQIAYAVIAASTFPEPRLLITGGGAYNKFLVKRISAYSGCSVVVPDRGTVKFKEAAAFAFLGVLRMRGEINILKSVTGAKRNSSGGKIFIPD